MGDPLIWLFVAIVIVGAAFLVIMGLTRKTSKNLDQSKYRERWLTISNSITSEVGTQQLAIINADKLLDQALKQRGIAGETMGDRMKTAKDLFSNNGAIWSAHKLRNRIVHEDSSKLNPIVTRKAMSSFKVALKDIGAL